MPPGKLAAQAGHAFLESFLVSSRLTPELASIYAADPPGTKVTLCARSLQDLEEAYQRALFLKIPCALITDSGHILPPHFDGSPVITALGLGPATRSEVRTITRRFALVP